jgi:hypothetical protein
MLATIFTFAVFAFIYLASFINFMNNLHDEEQERRKR